MLLVDHLGERRFFDRAGIYDDPGSGAGYPDNGERFLFFARAALEGLKRLAAPVDVLHAHDHQAAWTPCFVRTHEAGNPNLDTSRLEWVITVHAPMATDGSPGTPMEIKRVYSVALDAETGQWTDGCIGCAWLDHS